MSTTLPRHRVNVLTGTRGAKVVENPGEYANLINKAKRPLLVLGPLLLNPGPDGKLMLQYALDIARAANIPTCATAHIKGKMDEHGVAPDCVYDAVEIANALKDPDWRGVKQEGNHDLVLVFGIRSDLGNQALSVLKHFAPHLKTMTLCKHYFPNANYSLPNFRKDAQWTQFLDGLVDELKQGG